MITLASLYWNPKPELFLVPLLHLPILWYGLFFALGFVLGFPLFVGVLERFFLQRPDFEAWEIKGEIALPRIADAWKRGKSAAVQALNDLLVSSEDAVDGFLPPKVSMRAFYSLHAQAALRRLKLERLFPQAIISLRATATRLTDRLVVYVVVATVAGARIGHFLFYERPADYLRRPLELFQIWKGGLASHGAAVGIAVALALFAWRYREQSRGLTWLRLLDFICVPTALAGAFIRIGNFFNQEILGRPSDLPWAVIFGHPADRSVPIPRHPVQLYEAFFYAAVFYFLWRLTYRSKYLLSKGRLFGWFLVLVFGFRFLVEFWKEEQSQIMPFGMDLTMGQVLSIPAVLIGGYFLLRSRHKIPT